MREPNSLRLFTLGGGRGTGGLIVCSFMRSTTELLAICVDHESKKHSITNGEESVESRRLNA